MIFSITPWVSILKAYSKCFLHSLYIKTYPYISKNNWWVCINVFYSFFVRSNIFSRGGVSLLLPALLARGVPSLSKDSPPLSNPAPTLSALDCCLTRLKNRLPRIYNHLWLQNNSLAWTSLQAFFGKSWNLLLRQTPKKVSNVVELLLGNSL